MKRNLLLAAVLLLTGVAVLPAQESSNDANPLYHPVSIRMGTISVPPIVGVPFSATAVITNSQTLSDGTVAATRNINLIGRDTRGRTHGEMRSRVPESSQETPPLAEVYLYDPQTGMETVYKPSTRIATRQLRHEPSRPVNPSTPPNPLVKVEDLGTATMENIDVKGTRRTVIIPAKANGMGVDLTLVDEYWYSEDLHLNLLLRHSDPRTGEQTITLKDIERAEPAQEFFEVPQDYKIVDMTPPAGAPAMRRASGNSLP